MNKILYLMLLGTVLFSFSSCVGKNASEESFASTSYEATQPESDLASSGESVVTTAVTESLEKRIKLSVNGQEIIIMLYDTPTANAFYEALPAQLSFTDYNGTEKIAYPPETLPTEGEPDGCDPEKGDLCFYAPWGNLCIFYNDFRYSQSLIKLGRVEKGMDVVSDLSEDFTVTLERLN